MANVMKISPKPGFADQRVSSSVGYEWGSQMHALFINFWSPRVRLPSSLESGCSLDSSPLVARVG